MAANLGGPESVGAGPLHVAPAVMAPRIQKDRQCFEWTRVYTSYDSETPPPRSGAASVVVQGKLYMFGGYGGGTGRLDDFYSFDFSAQTWEKVIVVGDEKPGCRENNGVVISGSSKSIYLFGGYNGSEWLNDLWQFDIESKRWTCIQESSDPPPIGSPSKANSEQGSPTGTISVNGVVPTRRFGYVSVVHENKLVLFGGFDGTRWLNDMFVFDFKAKAWSEIYAKGTLPSVRSCPAWAKDDTHVYIQGGYDGVERKDDFFACNLSTYTWTQMPSLGTTPSPRYFHSCCLYGNKMYLYGGYSGSLRLADMYAYDFETNHWAEIYCRNGDSPSGRSSLVAQVYENSLYIFGGYNGRTVLNDFYKFRLKPIGIRPSGLVNDFRQLIDDSETADVRFLVEGNEVHAHRAILAVRSEYFRALLFNGCMRESIGATDEGRPIELGDVPYPVFLQVLEYLYTDTVSGVSMEAGIQLLIASERFMLDRLKVICEDIIRRDIDVDNAISILVASQQHNATGLKEISLEFILKNLTESAIQRGLSSLKSEPDLLVEIIKLSSAQSSPQAGATSPQTAGPISMQQGSAMEQVFQPAVFSVNNSIGGPFGTSAEWNARR